jgi:hypothetical protein
MQVTQDPQSGSKFKDYHSTLMPLAQIISFQKLLKLF